MDHVNALLDPTEILFLESANRSIVFVNLLYRSRWMVVAVLGAFAIVVVVAVVVVAVVVVAVVITIVIGVVVDFEFWFSELNLFFL